MEKKYRSEEILTHFRCLVCDKWWTVADAPKAKKIWYCTWCGVKQGK